MRNIEKRRLKIILVFSIIPILLWLFLAKVGNEHSLLGIAIYSTLVLIGWLLMLLYDIKKYKKTI